MKRESNSRVNFKCSICKIRYNFPRKKWFVSEGLTPICSRECLHEFLFKKLKIVPRGLKNEIIKDIESLVEKLAKKYNFICDIEDLRLPKNGLDLAGRKR